MSSIVVMSQYSLRIMVSIVLFILSFCALVVWRPSLMFINDSDSSKEEDKGWSRLFVGAKSFGFGPGKTLFSLGVMSIVLAVLSAFLCGLVEMTRAQSTL